MNKHNPSTDDILKKYGARIEQQIGRNNTQNTQEFSQSYERFRSSMMPEFSKYEKWCKTFGNLFTIKVGKKDHERINNAIRIAHLNVTPSEVVVFSTMLLLLTMFGGILLFTAIWLITGAFSLMLLFLILLLSIFLFYHTSKTPERLAIKWRLKASSQMVPAILYIVIYMKHTSNFEKAISFASQHLQPPLSLDFRKVFWEVEIGKYPTIKESMDAYLTEWKDYSTEFIEAFHLIESSLYEPNEGRRVAVLEKSLQVILDGVYDKMLKFTHNVKSPLTNVYMLGIVLPTLALAILPLASVMMGGAIQWYHVMILFNLLIPFMVINLTQKVMIARPGGHGETELLEQNPQYKEYKAKKHYTKGLLLGLPFIIIGSIPLILRYTPIPEWIGIARDYTWKEIGIELLGNTGIFGIIQGPTGQLYGPFGTLSMILSLCIPLGIAIIIITTTKGKTKNLLQAKKQSQTLEAEFTNSLFQLGNRIGDGTPAEIAFAKVAQSTRGTATEGFFNLVNENIQRLGMSLERSLFDKQRGAVIYYPSQLVATSMRILNESVKKGLQVAARSLMSISEYVKNIKKINNRLNDLLANIISDMKSNMTFLAPLLSGIIIGLAGMITTILATLATTFNQGITNSNLLGETGIQGILSIFDVTQMLPTYWLQIIIGIYLIQIVLILTNTLIIVKNGRDKLQTTSETGKNMKKTITLYTIIALGATIGLTIIAAIALQNIG